MTVVVHFFLSSPYVTDDDIIYGAGLAFLIFAMYVNYPLASLNWENKERRGAYIHHPKGMLVLRTRL